jgi:hypothetical protein
MPWTNDFTQKIDFSFAERFPVVRTGILNGEKFVVMPHEADSGSTKNNQLWLIGRKPLLRFLFARENSKPLHAGNNKKR